jgi:hypothetical protein
MVRVRGTVVVVVIAAMDLGGLTALDRWIRDFIVVLMSSLGGEAGVYSRV